MPTVKFQLRRDTAANWASVNPTLGPGEPAIETNTGKGKHGDGITPWASLPYSWVPPSAFMQTLLDDADAATARTTLGAVAATRSIATGTGLVGGGNLSADRTLSLATSGVTAGSYGSATKIPTITLDAFGRATIASENTIPALASGTYTPTITNVTNAAASTAYGCQYMRVGNVVTVSGRFDVDPTATGAVEIGISLPIASNLAVANQCGGTAFPTAAAGQGAAISGDIANARARAQWIATDTANRAYGFSFTYLIV